MPKKITFIQNRQGGYSLIELLIVVTLLAIVVIMSSDTFTIAIKQSGQQTKIVEAQVEGIIGLELLRYDIEHAGYGLPWAFQNAINYNEASTSPATNYNDSSSNVPRAIAFGNDVGFNLSDYLVIKSTAASINSAAQKWTYIITGSQAKRWSYDGTTYPATINLENGNKVIVIKPRFDSTSVPTLVMDGSDFTCTFHSTNFPSEFAPSAPAERFMIYGMTDSASVTSLRMPFNRTDYYIKRPADIPTHCAPGTGILYKGVINHGDGALTELPVIDCVADMQVIFRLDANGDGTIDSQINNLSALTAQQIREQIKEVRVYILAQEGQQDTGYSHSTQIVTMGEFGLGRNFDLATYIGTGWNRYRWKTYTLTVRPKDLS
ncbi:MAG: PilW family protein [Syntrophorhabdaceae bacterium]|nr:PilW family protein [Syntrophorhabdaceae bacterium]MDD5243117.1 PilW family protein [Syntrophorhabdaceae bacterium]